MSKKIKEKKVVEKEYRKKLIKKRKPNRSIAGDIGLYIFLAFMAWLMAVPLIYQINNAMKPLDELFRYPPRMFALNPTFDNFFDLFVTMGKSWVSFTRYLFNTLFVTVLGTAGHLLIASMGAFVLAKYEFPGAQTFFKVVTVSMMFVYQVTQIPNYLILNGMGLSPVQLVTGFAFLFTIERITDMMRTLVNVTSDVVVAAAIADNENEINYDLLNNPAAYEEIA